MNKRTLATFATTATVAALAVSACSPTPGATPAASAKVCVATSSTHTDPATDPVARALADAANNASITYQAGSGEAAPASLVASGCTLIVGTDSTTASSISEAARANPKVRFALVGASFTDAKGNPTSLKNGSVINVRASEAAYLAGYASAGMTTTGTLAVIGGSRDNVTASQMDAFAEGVDAYNLARARLSPSWAGITPPRTGHLSTAPRTLRLLPPTLSRRVPTSFCPSRGRTTRVPRALSPRLVTRWCVSSGRA